MTSEPSSQNSAEPLRTGLRNALWQAAVAVRALYEDRSFDVETKGDNTPLTSADLRANEILQRELSRLDPGAGWLSEETAEDDAARKARMAHKRIWIVDPIDGTREFVEATGEYSVSAGLAENGRPVLGGVALPQENLIVIGAVGPDEQASGLELWRYEYDPAAAEAGSQQKLPEFERVPAGMSQQPVPASLDQARIIVSSSEMRRGAYDPVKAKWQLEAQGSIARKLALVAIGRADLTVSLYPKSEWDICGGAALLACQPGAAVIELETNGPQRFNQATPRTVGLAAGAANLVREFQQSYADRGLELRFSYD